MEHAVIRKRLSKCFIDTFGPDIGENLYEANENNVSSWDSMETWRLAMSVEDEFGIRVGVDRFSTLTSFVAFENYLIEKTRG